MLNGSVFNDIKLTKIYYMTNQSKNPIFWFVIVLFFGGMVVGGIGWSLNESTIASNAKWGWIRWAGVAMIVVGALGFFTIGKRKSIK